MTSRSSPPHINENHPGEFTCDDWLTFSNPESAQFQSGIGTDQTIADEESEDEA